MDTIGVTQLIIILIAILLVGFYESAESAFLSVNKLRIKTISDEGNKKALKVYDLLNKSSKMFTSLLIANIITVLVATAVTISFAQNTLGDGYIVLALIILGILLIIFGGIIPKFIAITYPEKLSMAYVDVISVLITIMSPLTFIFNNFSRGFIKLFKFDLKEDTYSITEDELLTLVDASHEEGVIENEEHKMITNVVDFGDSIAKDVMVPRSNIVFGSDTMTYDELVNIFSTNKYTRIPIYKDSRDNVIGILNLKDLFLDVQDPDNFSLNEIIREPYFTYEYKSTFELFNDMKDNSISIAIVLDEYGETAGILTLEDLIEEIVGEIRDEYDEDEEDAIQAINESEFLIDGNTNIDEINDALGIELEPVDYENIAGHIIYVLDRIPEEGEQVIEGNVVLTVDSIVKNRIAKVHLEILPESNIPDDQKELDEDTKHEDDLNNDNKTNDIDIEETK